MNGAKVCVQQGYMGKLQSTKMDTLSNNILGTPYTGRRHKSENGWTDYKDT